MKKVVFLLFVLFSPPCLADLLPLDSELPKLVIFLKNYHIPLVPFAMFLTAIVETFLLWCFKYRGWKVLTYFFILNLISNLGINIISDIICRFIVDFFEIPGYGLAYREVFNYCVPFFELSVVLFEASLLGLMTGYNKKLWLSVFATNLISFLLGVLLFGL